jgi:ribonuclease D
MTNFLVDSDKKLLNLASKLKDVNEIGLDTEFIRESTYRPILALIQVSLPNGEIYLIDPIAIHRRDLISNIISSSNLTKIIHSSKQDIEALYSYTNTYPVNIFDTQIASNFISENSNVGYSTLVKNLCECDIKEGSWRTNWLERPLSTKKAEYAADDVRYLIEIKSLLIKRLKALDRFSWFEEEQLNELKKSNIIIEPKEAWKKINYPLHFSTQELALLKNIACWREDLAIKYDIPKRWIFSDSSATKLMLKNDKKTMDVVNNIKQQLTDSEMSKLMKILSLKKVIKNKNFSPKKDIEKKCNELLGYVSDEFNIDSTIIATKRDLEIFTNTNSEARFMKGWRYQIFGKLVQ